MTPSDFMEGRMYLRAISGAKRLTPRKENELAARIKPGDQDTRLEIIKANLGLVVEIALGYHGRGLPLLDLISEGNCGLLQAIERFDPTWGGQFSKYRSWWIHRAIREALASLCRPPEGRTTTALTPSPASRLRSESVLSLLEATIFAE